MLTSAACYLDSGGHHRGGSFSVDFRSPFLGTEKQLFFTMIWHMATSAILTNFGSPSSPLQPSRWLEVFPICSQTFPDAPRCSKIFTDTLKYSQILPKIPKCSWIVKNVSRYSQILPDSPRCSQMVLDILTRSQIRPRYSQIRPR